MLLSEHKIHRHYHQYSSHCVVPLELQMKGNGRKEDENGKRDNLLYYLKLHEVEWPSVAEKTHSVGRNLQTVLEESDAPTEEDYTY